MGSRKDRMKIREENGVTILDLGQVEIWDGADLALLRDTFARKCGRESCKSLGVDMTSVKYVPSGFFGMLFDWHEMGVAIRLYTPQPRVANMLWFRQFFGEESNGSYLLQSEPKELMAFDDSCDWNDEDEEVWVEAPRPSVGAPTETHDAVDPVKRPDGLSPVGPFFCFSAASRGRRHRGRLPSTSNWSLARRT